ncbi:MAG: citrate synthase [Patescibacteria group bacterium]
MADTSPKSPDGVGAEVNKADTREKLLAILTLPDGRVIELPIVEGSECEQAVDIRNLRKETGLTAFDPGYRNTASCESKITFLDGEKGILRFRGIPIEELAARSNFIETAMLLIWGELPNEQERAEFRRLLTDHEMLHEGLRPHFDAFPPNGKPMALLSAVLGGMRGYEQKIPEMNEENFRLLAAKIMSRVRTIAANTHNKTAGRPLQYPNPEFGYCKNFLHMLHSIPNKQHIPSETEIRALETFLILHADHEQNCSTSTVRMVGSSASDLFVSVAAGVNALNGKSHGGANAAVIRQLEKVVKSKKGASDLIARAKDPNDPFRLMGFGHAVYKNFDPRAIILKGVAEKLLEEMNINDPLFDLAKQLEKIALEDDYFVSRKLYPNVDFYSGIILRALGIPTKMFPVMFAIGRMPGWIAHWREQNLDNSARIHRPRQIYTGPTERPFVPMKDR